MPPSIVPLPARAGSMKFPDEDVRAVIELLGQCAPGQAVKLHDDPDAKENTSRRRAEIMKEQIETVHPDPIKSGFKLRGHVLTAGDPEVKKVSGKNYKFYPENWGAVSLVPDTDDDSTADTPPATDAPDATDAPSPLPPAPLADGADPDTDGAGNVNPDDSGAADGTDGNSTAGRRGRRGN